MKKKFGILIDSSSTLDQKFIKKHRICVAPLTISDSKFQTYKDDNIELPRTKLFERLKAGENFKTSMTPIGELTKIIEKMSKKYRDIIFIPISKGLSSQWQMAQLVKKEFDNLHIIESTSAAYANEVVLKKVVELVEEKKPLSTIIKTANALYDNTFSIFSVEETSGMRSGGRVTNAILKVIDFMSVQPIIRLNTSNEYAGIAKNYFKAIPKMIKAAKDWCDDIEHRVKEICIYFSGYSKAKLEFIKKTLAESFKFNISKICVRWIPSTVLVHTKLGSYGYTVLVD